MNNEIQTYSNNIIQTTVRTVSIGGEAWFVGKDICEALGYNNASQTMNDHCRGVSKRYPIVDSLGRTQEARVINEADMMRLICNSTLPAAEAFERWVFEEVLPSIRKHGMYATPQKIEDLLNDPDAWIQTLTALKEERAAKLALIEQAAIDAPKVRFAELVSSSKSCILIGEFAKILNQNGYHTGQNRFFSLLREQGYLGRRGNNKNLPTQKSSELGLFRIDKHVHTNSQGDSVVTRTPKLTGKGQLYFVEKLLDAKQAA